MRRRISAELQQKLERARIRIERWRSARPRGTRMPPQLWSEAVALARVCGTYAVARAVRVDYGALRRRLEAAGPGSREQKTRGNEFVELKGALLAATAGPVVEWSGADGTRLTIRLPVGHGLDVAGLVVGVQAGRR